MTQSEKTVEESDEDLVKNVEVSKLRERRFRTTKSRETLMDEVHVEGILANYNFERLHARIVEAAWRESLES